MSEPVVYTDEDGMMFKYLVSYSYKDGTYACTFWAESMADAEKHLWAIKKTGVVTGRLEGPQPPLRQGGQTDE